MRKIRYVFASFLVFFACGAITAHAAPKKAKQKSTATVAKKQKGKAADNRVHATRTKSGKIILDSRVTATRKLLAQEKGHMLVNHERGAAQLSPIMFPEFVVPPAGRASLSVAQQAGLDKTADPLSLSSSAAYVLDQHSLDVLFQKNADVALPMASVTKLMTALVVVESMQDMSEVLEITKEDASRALSSRLKVGAKTTRGNLLHLALMSSENRAAAALGRNYPGGHASFVAAMNVKAQALGMVNTHYVDTTGLSSNNVASARDLAKLVVAAAHYPILKQFSTDTGYVVNDGFRPVHYANTNKLVHNPNMNIALQKTGFISAAGNCLVLQAVIDNRPIVMVFLDAKGRDLRTADVLKIRNWLQRTSLAQNKPQT